MSAGKKNKKTSIREFVSESDLKFELYHMKYANQLKRYETMSSEEIIKKWNYDTQKKINRFLNDLEKDENKDKIAQEALMKNIEYLKSLPAPIDKDKIISDFNEKKDIYKQELLERQKDTSLPIETQDKITESLKYIQDLELKSDANKERFGVMLLLMIKNLRTMPSFSGYSENWATDFFSNAVEKTLLYLDNFDENLLSKRTGDKSKAFAYVTQICFNAFVNVINIRKKESEFLKDTISFETHNFDGVKNLLTPDRNTQEQEYTIDISSIYKITIKKTDTIEDINKKIEEGFEHMKYVNDVIQENKNIIDEIKYLKEITPEEEKTEDYYDYIKDLELRQMSIAENIRKTTLFVKMPKDSNINAGDLAYETPKDMDIIITQNDIKDVFGKKMKKNKKSLNGYDYETGLSKKEQDALEKAKNDMMQEKLFDEEW